MFVFNFLLCFFSFFMFFMFFDVMFFVFVKSLKYTATDVLKTINVTSILGICSDI